MTPTTSPSGDGRRSPGRLTVDPAAPGGARLGFPGGRLRSADWTALAQLAVEHTGELQLTYGGVVRIPGVRDEDLFREHAEEVGLTRRLMSRVGFTILASPLAGRLPGSHDLGELPEQLYANLVAHPNTSELADPRILGFDDGSGDVLAQVPDLAVVAGPEVGLARIHAGGHDTGLETSIGDSAAVLVAAVDALTGAPERLATTNSPGVVHDLVLVALSDHPLITHGELTATSTPTGVGDVPPVGWIDTHDGLVSLLAVVADGVVPARLAEFLGAIECPSTISADRVIGLHGLTEGMAEQVVRVLAPMGMVFDASSPLLGTRSPES